MKGYCLKSNTHWWLTILEPHEVEGSDWYDVNISAHKDNVILSYGDTAGTGNTPLFSSFEDISIGAWRVKSNALDGATVGEVTPMLLLFAYPYYHIYYICSYGLGYKQVPYENLDNYIDTQDGNVATTLQNMASWQRDIMDGQSGRTLTIQMNTIMKPIQWIIYYKANTTGWSQSDGWLNYTNPIYGIGIYEFGTYNYDRYLLDVSKVSDICYLNVGDFADLKLGIFDITKKEISSIKEDLNTATTELNTLTETVEENTTDIGDLSSRVSAIESETISKYVAR